MRRKLFLLLLFCLVSCCAGELAERLGMSPEIWIGKNGRSMPYFFSLEGRDLPGPPAAILFLHGIGECGTGNDKPLKHGIAHLLEYVRRNRIKVLLVVPQSWTGWTKRLASADGVYHMEDSISEPLAMAMELFQATIRSHHADPERIYVTGISSGGFGTWELIGRHPDFFSAAIPLCAAADLSIAERLKHLPVTVFHGERDEIVPVECSRNIVREMRRLGKRNLFYHEIRNCGHDVWNFAYPDSYTWEWLFQQKRTQRSQK